MTQLWLDAVVRWRLSAPMSDSRCTPMEAFLNPRTTQQLELPEEANHTKEKTKVGNHAEDANIAEPTNPSDDAARVGSSWGKEHDGDSAGGATETRHCQRAQPPSPETGSLRRHVQRAQVADDRVNARTKVNASTAAGPSSSIARRAPFAAPSPRWPTSLARSAAATGGCSCRRRSRTRSPPRSTATS